MKSIQIVHDGVVFQKTDAIVNAANTTLMGGGGVDGAIHDAAGDRLYWYFNDLGCTCQPGEAIESPGFNLPAKHIIHTVGPIWHEGKLNEAEILAECYRNCLDEAVKYECLSISFCCISVGVYRYPLEEATRIALKTVHDWLTKNNSEMLVRFCCYTDEEFETYKKAADEVGIEVSLDCQPVNQHPETQLHPEDLSEDLCRFLVEFESLDERMTKVIPEFEWLMSVRQRCHVIREIEEIEYKVRLLKYFLMKGIAGLPGGRYVGEWTQKKANDLKPPKRYIEELKHGKIRSKVWTDDRKKELYGHVWKTHRPSLRAKRILEETHRSQLLTEMRNTVYRELGIGPEERLLRRIFNAEETEKVAVLLQWDKEKKRYVGRIQSQNESVPPKG